LQVLALQLEENTILKENTDSIKKLADSSDRLVTMLDHYPDKINEKAVPLIAEMNALVAELKEISTNINKSTGEVKESSENFKNLGTDVKDSANILVSSLKQVEESSNALNKAGASVSTTVKDIQNMVASFSSEDDSSTPTEPDKYPPVLIQVQEGAIALDKSAQQVNDVLDKLNTLLDATKLKERAAIIDDVSQKTLAMTRLEAEGLIDSIFKKLLILIGVTFILAIIYQRIRKKQAVKA
jgi:ABC-type transporter Mla subunit MlaD